MTITHIQEMCQVCSPYPTYLWLIPCILHLLYVFHDKITKKIQYTSKVSKLTVPFRAMLLNPMVGCLHFRISVLWDQHGKRTKVNLVQLLYFSLKLVYLFILNNPSFYLFWSLYLPTSFKNCFCYVSLSTWAFLHVSCKLQTFQTELQTTHN